MPPINGFLLDSKENGTNSSFYDTDSYSPGANRTIILCTTGIANIAPPVIPGVSGNGLVWSLVLSQLYDFGGVDRSRLTVYRGLSSTPTVGVTRVQYAGLQLRQQILVFQFDNTDIGNLGANAIVGSPVSKKENTGLGLNPSVTMPAAEDQANATLGIIATGNPVPLVVPGIGFILLGSAITAPTQDGGNFAEFSTVPKVTVDWNLGNNTAEKALAGIELRNVLPSGAPAPAQVLGRPGFVSGNLITP